LDSIRLAEVSPFAERLPVNRKQQDAEVPIWTPEGVELRQNAPRVAFHMPTLRDVQWKGDLIGSGVAQVAENSITLLQKEGPGTIWRNFRIVPKGY
jgi:hypothetical protein